MDTKEPEVKSTTYFDSDFCGQVPLNQSNMVQPHGALLVLDKSSAQIIQHSENASVFLFDEERVLLHTAFSSLLTADASKTWERARGRGWTGKLPLQLLVGKSLFLAQVHAQPQYFIAEVEPLEKNLSENIHLLEDVKFALAEMDRVTTVLAAGEVAVHELQRISGFDKVMLYRFDEEWNGEVIAEALVEGMDHYLGLHFPASDIPKQARDLYQRNTYRLIPDINGPAPVKLTPVLNPVTHSFTNLTDTNLRSIAPVHVQYLRNMGVQASMSTRVLHNGKLWGLIACHHRTAKYLPYSTCAVFEMLSLIIGAKITSVEGADGEAFKAGQAERLHEFKLSVHEQGALVPALINHLPLLQQLLSADGIVVAHGKAFDGVGAIPGKEQLNDLVFWLQTTEVTDLWHTRSLAHVMEDAAAYADVACGALVLPIQPEKGFFILGFRKEEVQEVSWSGNPNERIKFEQDKKNYHPRNSFAVWQQTVTGRSRNWMPVELEGAERLRAFITAYQLRKL